VKCPATARRRTRVPRRGRRLLRSAPLRSPPCPTHRGGRPASPHHPIPMPRAAPRPSFRVAAPSPSRGDSRAGAGGHPSCLRSPCIGPAAGGRRRAVRPRRAPCLHPSRQGWSLQRALQERRESPRRRVVAPRHPSDRAATSCTSPGTALRRRAPRIGATGSAAHDAPAPRTIAPRRWPLAPRRAMRSGAPRSRGERYAGLRATRSRHHRSRARRESPGRVLP
jgi:hypothetical protein